MKIAICDDNETELAVTEQAVKEFIFSNKSNDEITLKTFRSGLDLLSFANTSIAFDLLILDIIMPDINGIALAEEIRQKNKDCKIIFLTTSPEFAVNSYDVNAFHYLIKPFQKEKLGTILKRALNDIGEEKSESILIKDKKCLTKINLHTIVYIESVKHTINFHLIDGNVAICYGKMDEYVDILSKDSRFIKCHRSFAVNMKYIASLEKNCFILSDKTLIPISRNAYGAVKNTYIDYFFKQENEAKL